MPSFGRVGRVDSRQQSETMPSNRINDTSSVSTNNSENDPTSVNRILESDESTNRDENVETQGMFDSQGVQVSYSSKFLMKEFL